MALNPEVSGGRSSGGEDRRSPLDCAVKVEGLTKFYGPLRVLKGLNLELKKGDFLVIFGANGSGKSTFIRILSTLSRPTSGRVFIEGLDLEKQAPQIRQCTGVLLHNSLLYNELSVYENLNFYGRMYHVPDLAKKIEEIIVQVGMESRLRQRVGTLSHGMQKRVSIARALLHDPALLLFDEPESGLDFNALQSLMEIIREPSGKKRSAIITTHNIEQGFEWASHVAILARGQIQFIKDKKELSAASFLNIYRSMVG